MLALNRRSTHTWAEVQSIKRLYEAGVYHLPPPEQIAEAMLLHAERSITMALLATKPLTTRDPGPYDKGRRCPTCKAELRTTNPGPSCDPCRKGETDDLTMDEVLDRINRLPMTRRAEAFDALNEIHAEHEGRDE